MISKKDSNYQRGSASNSFQKWAAFSRGSRDRISSATSAVFQTNKNLWKDTRFYFADKAVENNTKWPSRSATGDNVSHCNSVYTVLSTTRKFSLVPDLIYSCLSTKFEKIEKHPKNSKNKWKGTYPSALHTCKVSWKKMSFVIICRKKISDQHEI